VKAGFWAKVSWCGKAGVDWLKLGDRGAGCKVPVHLPGVKDGARGLSWLREETDAAWGLSWLLPASGGLPLESWLEAGASLLRALMIGLSM
jgi:hypothetical protein